MLFRSRRVILAAGTFGSTEILLRSRQHGLALSPMLGRRFSTNGDVIASVHGQQFEVNAVANEDTPPEARQIGPTITAMVDLRTPAAAALAEVETSGFVIQDLAVPGPLRRAFEEVFSTAATLRAVQKFDFSDHADGPDPCAISPAVISNSLPVAMIGHDTSDGFLRLPRLRTLWLVRYSLLTIVLMLGLGTLTRYSGTDTTLGLAFANTGVFYPFFGTLMGWIGVAMTGSDTASNVLFGGMQKVAAEQLGLSPNLMGAANSSGGVMGKMIDAQSIVVASTAARWFDHEGDILRYVFFLSIALACLVGLYVTMQADVWPFTLMVVH